MKRVPEPEELMDEAAQALAYAEADFSESNTLFIELYRQQHPAPFTGRALDLGCGPADIPVRFCRTHPECLIDAVDGAAAMLDLAQQAINRQNLAHQITLHQTMLPATDLPAAHYDALLSNSLLHHLSNPLDLWQTIKRCGKTGAQVLIMDLLRPDTPEQAAHLVELYAADAPEVLATDFRNSLFAAYTVEEVTAQLSKVKLDALNVSQVSDRHLAVQGRL